VEKSVVRGSVQVRVDDKGRVKLPNLFRHAISETHGRDVFVTSVTGDAVLVYPMPTWLEVERKVAQAPASHPARTKFLERVNYYGQETDFDPQGRLLIPPRLREVAQISGDVDIIAKYDHLEIWNSQRFAAKLAREPFTEENALALADLGI
jgi:MraZ protein